MTTPSSPAWLRVYRHFTEDPPPIGAIVLHETLCQVAGLEWDVPRLRSRYYHAVAQACRELEEQNSRTLLTARGEGYQLVAGNAHLEKALTGMEAVRRKLVRAAGTAATVDVTSLTGPEVERVRRAQATILEQMELVNSKSYFPPPQYHATQSIPE